jgi:hypothetical protein
LRTKLEILSAAELARNLDLPNMTVFRAIEGELIEPDGRVGRTFVFRRSRVSSLARILGGQVRPETTITARG